MTAGVIPWTLPGLSRWLDGLAQKLAEGVAVLSVDASEPPGLLDALATHLPSTPIEIEPSPDCAPATAIAEALDVQPTLESLLSHELLEHTVVVSLTTNIRVSLDEWRTFLFRYAVARASSSPGPALLVLEPPSGLDVPREIRPDAWRKALRRGDRVIWAEEHLPANREGLTGEFAISLAVELCGWRLDLSAALTQAGIDDLAAPIEWLRGRIEAPIRGIEPSCPLACLADQNLAALHSRVWRAQLAAIFPVLEEQRLELVSRHRSRLQLDQHLRDLGVASVEEIELGALRHQLSRHLSRPEAERLDLLARARNALAHRQPISPEDASKLLRASL